MIGEPALPSIDEPTEGLAAIIIGEIAQVLESMKARISMIVVEQNLALVSRLADRIYIMKEGAIFQEISDPERIRQPRHYQEYL